MYKPLGFHFAVEVLSLALKDLAERLRTYFELTPKQPFQFEMSTSTLVVIASFSTGEQQDLMS